MSELGERRQGESECECEGGRKEGCEDGREGKW